MQGRRRLLMYISCPAQSCPPHTWHTRHTAHAPPPPPTHTTHTREDACAPARVAAGTAKQSSAQLEKVHASLQAPPSESELPRGRSEGARGRVAYLVTTQMPGRRNFKFSSCGAHGTRGTMAQYSRARARAQRGRIKGRSAFLRRALIAHRPAARPHLRPRTMQRVLRGATGGLW
jgi:hypothetical protein